jgi:hypothetical protein
MVEAAGNISAEAIARFAAAEARLYPMAMADTDGYERAIRLVSLLAADLRKTCQDVDALLQRRVELISLLPGIAATAKLSLSGLPPETVVDAALALRYRELQAVLSHRP